jgi:hypothetical protein
MKKEKVQKEDGRYLLLYTFENQKVESSEKQSCCQYEDGNIKGEKK